MENWKAFAGGWTSFLDEAECCLWGTLFLDGGKVPIIVSFVGKLDAVSRLS